MKLFVVLSLLALSSMAETYKYTIDKMHCGGCAKMIKSAVCGLPGIKACDVTVGAMEITSKDGEKIDQAAVTKAIADLNAKNKEEYTITASTKVDETTTKAAPTKKEKKQ